MKENLRTSANGNVAFCYEDSLQNCEQNGAFFSYVQRDSLCPKGWHLPNTSEVIELVQNLPGEVNPNNGKLLSKDDAKFLNIAYGGGKAKIEGLDRYYGKNSQEIWLVASDSIWTDLNNSNKEYYLSAIHIYAKGQDSINIEPTFTDTPNEFYGYCRCIKDTP